MTHKDSHRDDSAAILKSFESLSALDEEAASVVWFFSTDEDIAEYLNLVRVQRDRIVGSKDESLSKMEFPAPEEFPRLSQSLILLAEQNMQK
ncbi:MAG: hypothetical protein JW812_01015 [Alphaproteobacteria bacterium]|nr:hypothetical protein [Alphaproteobacteria bacterium]MBN2779637.1 hypothetical protein [Alphaproteobacteria bacterium]